MKQRLQAGFFYKTTRNSFKFSKKNGIFRFFEEKARGLEPRIHPVVARLILELREQSLFMAGVGTEEKCYVPSKKLYLTI